MGRIGDGCIDRKGAMEAVSKSDAWTSALTMPQCRVGCLGESSGLYARASARSALTTPSYAERAKFIAASCALAQPRPEMNSSASCGSARKKNAPMMFQSIAFPSTFGQFAAFTASHGGSLSVASAATRFARAINESPWPVSAARSNS
jgi:hypothetical protein